MALADFQENQYTQDVWNELVSFFGNEMGAAAMMANLYAESGCTPWRCQGWYGFSTAVVQGCANYYTQVDNGTITREEFAKYGWSDNQTIDRTGNRDGYGLAQWTTKSRKEGLYDSRSGGQGIEELSVQLNWLESELNTDYTSTRDVCMNTNDIDSATDYVLIHFEGPRNPTAHIAQRRQYAHQIYDTYSGTASGYAIRLHAQGNCQPYATLHLNDTQRIYRAEAGTDVFIHANVGDGDYFLIWTSDYGGATIDVDTSENTFFTMPSSVVDITAHATGTTPTPPYPPTPTPTRAKRKHHMPIWMYPMFRI